MIYSDSTEMDNDKIKEQVQQIKELTNRTEDEILVVLYDANYDTEQAINMLLERDETENKSVSMTARKSYKSLKLKVGKDILLILLWKREEEYFKERLMQCKVKQSKHLNRIQMLLTTPARNIQE